MLKKFIIVLLVSYSYYSSAQFDEKDFYTFPESYETKKLSGKIHISAEKFEIENESKVNVNQYFEEVNYNSLGDFIDGTVYIDFEPHENYLNNILNVLYPENLKNSSPIKIYIARDPFFNASANLNNSIYLNIGVLKEIETEAELAFIIGHELAHCLNKDAKNTYFRYLNLKKKLKYSLRANSWVLNYFLYSQNQENSADKMSIEFMLNAGYSIEPIQGIYNYFEKLTKIASYKGWNIEDNRYSTHPTVAERVKNYKKILTKANTVNKSDFIVSRDSFLSMKSASNKEVKQLLIRNFNPHTSTEYFFMDYLKSGNDTNLYYLLEALRQAIYIYNCGTSKFLSYNYSLPSNTTIFDSLHFLFPDESQMNNIKQSNYEIIENKEFRTYGEAFEYFAKCAEKNEIRESYLTIALFNHDNKQRMDYYIDRYISNDGIMNNYAESLKSNSLYHSQTKDDIFCLGSVSRVDNTFNGDYTQFRYSYHFRHELAEYTQDIIDQKHTGTEMFDYSKNILDHFSEGINLYEYVNKIKWVYKENENLDLFLLYPDLWDFFNKHHLRSIQYIDFQQFYDQTQTFDNTMLYVIASPVLLIKWLVKPFYGSYKHAYMINYTSFNSAKKEDKYYNSSIKVRYKPRELHVQNSIYYLMQRHYEEK